MPAILLPCGYALFLWWFTTGIILFLNRLPRRTFRWSLIAATALAVWAIVNLRASFSAATIGGAYQAFTAAIILWGWLEMSFLMGFITGPRTAACGADCRGGWQHFLHAAQAVIYNDVATALLVAAVGVASRHAPNRLSFWVLTILWLMRISAKLNLFLGVRNLGEAFLPPHLQYLLAFFRRRSMNWLFPVSVAVALASGAALLGALVNSDGAFRSTSVALLLTLLTLGLIEHWFMILPLPSERLWSWALYDRTRGPRRGRHTPRTILASDSVMSSHKPPRSVRSTSAN